MDCQINEIERSASTPALPACVEIHEEKYTWYRFHLKTIGDFYNVSNTGRQKHCPQSKVATKLRLVLRWCFVELDFMDCVLAESLSCLGDLLHGAASHFQFVLRNACQFSLSY